MAKKTLSQIEELQKKIESAQEAVSTLTDESLKVAAFQTVLQWLLATDAPTGTANEKVETKKPNPAEPKEKVQQPRGPKGRVEELINDGFFSEKRTIGDVKEALEAHGWFHKVEDLNPTLLRLLKEKKLRRIKEPENEGGKLIWRYSKW
jgi:hypothetical protein